MGIGPTTSFLPRMCSTTELLGHSIGGGGGIRTPEAISQLIYSQSPLAAWVPHRAAPQIVSTEVRKPDRSASLQEDSTTEAVEVSPGKVLWSFRPDSNRKPTAYKAVALPVELRKPAEWRQPRLSLPPLTSGLEQGDCAGDRSVEALNPAGHGNGYPDVRALPYQTLHPPALAADDDRR